MRDSFFTLRTKPRFHYLLLVLALTASVVPVFAAHRVTVEQLHSILLEQKQRNKTDDETARAVRGLELTERLSPSKCAQLLTELQPGRRTILALTLLGDVSAFYDLPSAELPVMDPPDLPAQKVMLKAAVEYVTDYIQRLPNFYATRTTVSFDDSQAAPIDLGARPTPGQLHFTQTTTQEVTFRNGKEELNGVTGPGGSKQQLAPIGLTSWGEFGALQAIILTDSASNELKWSHWEREGDVVVAVFEFKVSQATSHYLVNYCCVRSSEGPDFDHPYIQRDVANAYKAKPAYHGTLSLDPKSGAILRITLEAELKPSDPISQMNIAVQFDKVSLGETSYICPVQSVAVSSTLVGSDVSSAVWKVLRINDVTFTNYHRFGSTVRILPGVSEPQ